MRSFPSKTICGSLLAALLVISCTQQDSGSSSSGGSSANTPSALNAEPKRHLIKVSSIQGAKQNAEFERNVSIVKANQQRASTLQSQIELATNASNKAALQQQYNQVLQDLDAMNKRMIEAYGFSITRNYVRVVEKSQLYMDATADEVGRFQELQKQRQQNSGSGQ